MIFVAGCAVGPDYKSPVVWSPKEWSSQQVQSTTLFSGSLAEKSNLTAAHLDVEWWKAFNDPLLNSLVERVASQNLDVQAASARIEESRASLGITGAAQYPTLSGNGLYSRTQSSSMFAERASRSISGEDVMGGRSIPQWNVWYYGLDAMWEADLWGKVRRDVEKAEATLQESEEERRAVLIAQMAEVARNYITLRGLQTQLDIVVANRKVAVEEVELTEERYRGGLTTQLDVENARSQLKTLDAQIPQLKEQVRSTINAIGLLLGAPPQALAKELDTPQKIPVLPYQVPVGLPSQLAERRPDIRKADAELHAATADIGVAEAQFYPRLILNGNLGFQALSFRDLGFWNARSWNVGPIITIPFFEGGKLRGQLKLAEATQKEAAVNYRKTVLTAWREVDDAMDSYQKEQSRNRELQQNVQANRNALALAREQYQHGTQTFLNVLDAQRRVLSSEVDLVLSTTTQSTNLVKLYNALGGGWEHTYKLVRSEN
ncbi:efflux transporter outer membrane subunit [Entomobacter blattae]|uniref:efflux transporter outer membrane subunit n=1 Tax=Entomobacter blattae TaxID=2762277 RepID=UPI001EF13B02|nr:efflux transporter outer membrane subunit [Entomobacter blattae]